VINHLLEMRLNGDFDYLAKRHGVIIYGAGIWGTNIVKILKGAQIYKAGGLLFDFAAPMSGVLIHCVADTDKTKHGTHLHGIPVVAPETLSNYDLNTPVIITPIHFFPAIVRSLKRMGFKNFFAVDAQAMYYANKFEEKPLDNHAAELEKNRSEIEAVRKLFKERKSLAVFDARLEWLLNGDIEPLMREFNPKIEHYFPDDIIRLGEKEVFVDCGVFKGETSIEFALRSRFRYKMIYAFEPDAEAVLKIKDNTQALENFKLYNIGVGAKKDVLYYDGNNSGGGGQIVAEDPGGYSKVEIDSLDNLLLEKPFAPTYIKMDIEGAEIDALTGAAGIIKRDKPKLAVCVYHRPGDLWEIPLLIHDILPDYEFYLRHHYGYSCQFDTVLYALPQKRRA
jgi:FkbM family methyltransferase